MPKILLISGSPRKGNTDFILNKIFESIKVDKELIFLRYKNIRHCCGCLSCDKTNECSIKDDMDEINKKMIKADIFVIGSPNYFDNVPGLLKDFIDRTNPFHETNILKGKKLISIVVGGGEIKNSKRVAQQALTYFAAAHNLDFVNSYYFQGLKIGEVADNPKALKKINMIIKKVGELIGK